jgi:CO/xanthine dehydrogenase Mo-binding subunit
LSLLASCSPSRPGMPAGRTLPKAKRDAVRCSRGRIRPPGSQRIRLGAERDGRIVAVAHDATMHTNPQEEFVETSALATRSFYAAPHRLMRHRLVPLDMLRG